MRKFLSISLLLLMMTTSTVANVWARLDGEVAWGYASYKETSDGEEDKTASHFTQRYSVMHSTTGLLSAGRLGSYDFGIGAEWAAFDTEIDRGVDDKKTIDNDALKLLFNGEVLLAPGGLPFRLDAYSYDVSRITFDRTDGAYYRGSADESRRLNYDPRPFGLVRPNIVADLQNGQTIVSGVQFMAGIRNGSYLGRYREILSRWPRILVDYRDVYRRDTQSFTPKEYRDRNLAFVSLNKKDNWFHYRTYSHKDYLNKNRDTQEDTILLGTIDHELRRQWINLTNWIKISVDGSYSTSSRDEDPVDENRFDLNFFTSMRRKAFSADGLLNLQRIKRGGTLDQILDVPVFVNKRLNPDTNVRSTFQVWNNKKNREDLFDDREDQAFYSKVLLQTNMRSRVRIDPSIEAETRSGDAGDGNAIRGRAR